MAHLFRGSSSGSRYSRLIGPNAVTCVTCSPDIGPHNLNAVPIILALIVIGTVIYVIRRRRRNPPDGSA